MHAVSDIPRIVLGMAYVQSVCVGRAHGTQYMASFFIAGRLYFNSLLASLNLRVSSAINTGGAGPADTGLSAATCDLQEQSVPAPWMERTLESAVTVCDSWQFFRGSILTIGWPTPQPSLVMKRSVYGGSSQDASEETYKPEVY
jgi:hypothetical protein